MRAGFARRLPTARGGYALDVQLHVPVGDVTLDGIGEAVLDEVAAARAAGRVERRGDGPVLMRRDGGGTVRARDFAHERMAELFARRGRLAPGAVRRRWPS